MELILAIMFFSLSAAVCVRLFVGAHVMSGDTTDLNNATIWSQNIAEVFTAEHGSLEKIALHFPDAYVTYDPQSPGERDGLMVLFFDDGWEMLEDDHSGCHYEVMLKVAVMDAEQVYADVNTYGVDLIGKAAAGEITIIDVSGAEDVVLEVPQDQDLIILTNRIDSYLGKEGQQDEQ